MAVTMAMEPRSRCGGITGHDAVEYALPYLVKVIIRVQDAAK